MIVHVVYSKCSCGVVCYSYEEEIRHLRLTLATVESEREAMKQTFDEDLSILQNQLVELESQRSQLEAAAANGSFTHSTPSAGRVDGAALQRDFQAFTDSMGFQLNFDGQNFLREASPEKVQPEHQAETSASLGIAPFTTSACAADGSFTRESSTDNDVFEAMTSQHALPQHLQEASPVVRGAGDSENRESGERVASKAVADTEPVQDKAFNAVQQFAIQQGTRLQVHALLSLICSIMYKLRVLLHMGTCCEHLRTYSVRVRWCNHSDTTDTG